MLSHRGKISLDRIRSIYRGPVEPVLRAAVVLRLAHRLCRSREPVPIDGLLTVKDSARLTLTVETGQLDGRPLTRADLSDEARMLRRVGLKLILAEADPDPTSPTA